MKTVKEVLQAGARNNAWSNAILYKACAQLTAEEFTRTRTSFFPSIQLTLHHNLMVDLYYFDAIKRNGVGLKVFDEEATPPTFAELYRRQTEMDRKLVEFCDSRTDETLQAEFQIDRGEEGFKTESIAATLSHLFQHQIHHRGQTHAMLSGTSVKPPQLDEFYLRGDAKDREQDLRRLQIPWTDENPLRY